MERHYLLKFRTDTGELATFRIPYAKENPSISELKAAMVRMIATGIVDAIEGELVSPDTVSLISTAATEYDVE